MNRNAFGENIDQGIPLSSKEDFDLLYIDSPGESYKNLTRWIQEGDGPLIFGGQIGSGKSTLIEKVFLDLGIKPDISIPFDRKGTNLASGDSWAVVLGLFIQKALEAPIDLPASNLLSALMGSPSAGWADLATLLLAEPTSISILEKQRAIVSGTSKEEGSLF